VPFVRWFLVLLCALAIVPPARADSAAGLELATRATKQARSGDRRGAIELLEQAYSADPQEDYLVQIAELYEALAGTQGDLRDVRLAIAHYQLALVAEKNPVEVQAIEGHLRQLRGQLFRQPAPESPPPVPPPPLEDVPVAPEAPVPAVEKSPQDVPIVFAPEDPGDRYTVAFENQICEAPCSLHLKPGFRVLTLTSSGDERKVSLAIPETKGAARLPPTRHSFFVAGLALTIVGAIVTSTFWAIFSAPCDGSTTCVTANSAVWPIVGGGMLITGASFLAYHQARDTSLSVDSGDSDKPAVRLSSIGIQPLRNGGAAAGVGLSF
jgi:hypothetical protein